MVQSAVIVAVEIAAQVVISGAHVVKFRAALANVHFLLHIARSIEELYHSTGVGVVKRDEDRAEILEFRDFEVAFCALVHQSVDGTYGRRVDNELVVLCGPPFCAQSGGERIARHAVERKRCVVPERVFLESGGEHRRRAVAPGVRGRLSSRCDRA